VPRSEPNGSPSWQLTIIAAEANGDDDVAEQYPDRDAVGEPSTDKRAELRALLLQACEELPPQSAPPPSPEQPPPAADPQIDWSQVDLSQSTLNDLEALIASALTGDANAVKAFQAFLANGGSPAWREVGDLAVVAEKMLLTTMFSGKAAPALAARRRSQELRQALADDHATPLEKLAIDRVILASMFAAVIDSLVAADGMTGVISAKHIQAQHLAERRVQAALKSLQTAREISRAAVAGPLRLFGSRSRAAEPPARAATG
jgi:hypothetical protein